MRSPRSGYGRYRVEGDPARSRYFCIDRAPAVEPLLRTLSLAPLAPVLGRSFQGPGAVRILTEDDHCRLTAFAAPLPCLWPQDAP